MLYLGPSAWKLCLRFPNVACECSVFRHVFRLKVGIEEVMCRTGLDKLN